MAILSADTNVWRIERAGRFSVLIDGAAFFAAVRQAALSAQRSIVIMGWDLDSRTRLVGESGEPTIVTPRSWQNSSALWWRSGPA